jgi:2-polyprenyl-3-methyl-5-hydroxy-6-metoxy-1,4-benzoquinol methylase
MKDTKKRKELEIVYQAEVAQKTGEIQPTPDFIIERFRQAKLWRLFPKEYLFRYLGDFANKEILDFGCGDGEISTQLAKLGAKVTALDISPELVELTKKRAELDEVKNRIEFIAGDIAELPLPKNKFDYVVCYAVIHHVDINETLPQLYSSLKPGGSVIMIEPIAFSPLLQKIIKMVPVERDGSPVEHQLSKKDLDLICRFFDKSKITFFEFFGRMQRLFPNRNKIDKGHPFTKAALILLHSFDRLLLNLFPMLWRYYGTALILGHKTFKKNRSSKLQ